MGRERTGSVWKKESAKGEMLYYGRVCFVDARGKRHDIKRRAKSEANARKVVRDILNELDAQGEKAVEAHRLTFAQLAEWYEGRYLQEASYVSGRKVSGVRQPDRYAVVLNRLREHFGPARVRSITTADVEDYKTMRLTKPVVTVSPPVARRGRGVVRLRLPVLYVRQRAVATVNRELSLLRRMMNVCRREGWIARNPCEAAKTLISVADENRRTRVVTRGEEARMLAACAGRRAHMRPAIVCALDTGMRHGEIVKMTWRDVDFAGMRINVRAFNTKTATERRVGMTRRLAAELEEMHARRESDDALVFGFRSQIKRAWDGVRREAGLADVKFHDLRHTAATRLVEAGLPIAELSRILGHSSPVTTYRYINPSSDSITRAAGMLEYDAPE